MTCKRADNTAIILYHYSVTLPINTIIQDFIQHCYMFRLSSGRHQFTKQKNAATSPNNQIVIITKE
jgi:hypothetical protein